MSSACSQLRRIWQTGPRTTKATAAAPPIAAKTRQPSPATAIDRLFKEPNLDVLISKFKQKSASSYFRNRQSIYVYTIDRLARHRRFSAIEELIEPHKKFDEFAKEGHAVRFISLYGRAGMFEHAHKLFDELPELKCPRTKMSFNALLGAALHSKEYDQVRELFNEYPSKLGFDPDAISYNILIKALGELGLVDDAVSMVDEMINNGVEPNLITFNSLIDGVYGKKGFSDGEKIWDLMLEEINGLIPDIRSYNTRLKAMIDEGMIIKAVNLFEQLKIMDLNPTSVTYNHLIKGFCDKGDLEEAKKWYWKLAENSNLLPDGYTFETLIDALGDEGDGDLKFDLSKKMLGRQFLVDEAKLQRVVDGLVRGSKVEQAEELVGLATKNYYHRYNLVVPSAE